MTNSRLSSRSVVAFGVGDAGYQLIMQLQSMYMLYYMINFAGISGTVSGMIVAIAGIWDAVNDPLMGVLVDRTNTKQGKARPFILWGSFPLVLCVIAVFNIPAFLTGTSKILWVAIAYIGYGTFRTLVSIPYGTLMVRMTDNQEDRVRMARAKSLIGTVGVFLPIALMTFFATGRPNEGSQMSLMAIICMIFYLGCNLFVFFGTKEIPRETDNIKRNPLDGISVLLHNKYWLINLAISVSYGIQQAITTGSVVFYLTSKYGRADLMMVAMGILIVAMMAGAATGKPMVGKFGQKKTAQIGIAIAILAGIFRLVMFDMNIVVMLIGFAVAQFGFAWYMLVSAPLLAQTVDYGELTQGKRIEALSSSSRTFADKIGSNIAIGIMGVMLDITGYIEITEAIPNPVQPDSAINALFGCSAGVPFIFAIVMLIFMSKFNIERDIKELKAKQANTEL